jgi:hypothetical protein
MDWHGLEMKKAVRRLDSWEGIFSMATLGDTDVFFNWGKPAGLPYHQRDGR